MRVRMTSGKRQVGLQNRFLLGLAGILVVFSAFAAGLIYFYEKSAIEQEAFQKTEIIMSAASASMKYVRNILRPRMYELLGEDDFIIEAMSSSYISRAVMDNFKEDMTGVDYRRVAVNARNPLYEATELEREMIRYFRGNPDQSDWSGIKLVEGEQYFMRYKPVVYTENCSRCHGKPEDAPAAIIAQYGKERGFSNNSSGYVNGLVSVGIPVEGGLAKTREVAFSVFGTVFLAVFFLFGIITFFFNRLVVQNLREVLGTFRDTFQDEKSEEFMAHLETREEIADLNVLARTMADHLHETRGKLKDYAENLELKVDERTRKLRQSESRLRENILARNRELKTLNVIAELITGSVDLNAILPKVVEHSLKSIPARGAGIYLLGEEVPRLDLQCHINAPELVESLEYKVPENLEEAASEPGDYSASICDAAYGHLNFFSDRASEDSSLNLPLCCRDKVLGVMTFVGTGFHEITAELQELLFSIGRQVGITIDSLQNLARLSANKDLLQSVFDGITDLVALVDCNGRFRMVNRAFLMQYNLDLEEIVNQPVAGSGDVKHPFTGALKLLDRQEYSENVEYMQAAGGVILETHYYPIFDAEGAVVNVVCYAKDVTEKKTIEQRMYQTEKLLALGQMAAGVAHEINNPLGVILCYTDILKDDLAASSQSLGDLEIIEKHARSCQHIVSDLLDFAREGKTVKQTVQLNDLIEEVLTVVRTQLRKDNIHILTELSPELPPVLLDSDKIKQVMMNLIINAVQAFEDSGEIGIYTVFIKDKGRIQFIVEDNGGGIPEDIVGKIFDPFFTSKDPGQGTGLGLSLAYGIIHDHNGEIQVESEPGNWTRFTVSLPVASKGGSLPGEDDNNA